MIELDSIEVFDNECDLSWYHGEVINPKVHMLKNLIGKGQGILIILSIKTNRDYVCESFQFTIYWCY